MSKHREKPQKQEVREKHVSRVLPAKCLGASCIYFAEKQCVSEKRIYDGVLEKFNKPGAMLPISKSRTAVYLQHCGNSPGQLGIVDIEAVSPNGQATPEELAADREFVEAHVIIMPRRA